ncbi:hypothetical protein PAAL109150_17395 [Paenibacillus alkaliterrae]|nr:hypothetical protein [Paenibacillus alkaliterrae]
MDVDGESNSIGEILPKAVSVAKPEFARSEMITVEKTYKVEQEAI